jgi:hypothetical protein
VISGTDTICQGETATLQVTLTGTAPWSITVLVNGSGPSTINNIQTASYALNVTAAGTYTISTDSDSTSSGSGTGSGTVVSHAAPTAMLSGGATDCGDQEAELSVALAGAAPWRFSYRLNNGTPVFIQNVTTSPRNISVTSAGTYSLVEVSDQYCPGTVSGNVTVNFTTAPDVNISGLETAYIDNSIEWVLLSGTPTGGEFSGNGIIYYDNKWYFLPGLALVGINDIVYQYRSSPGSCYGYDTVEVRIFESGAEIVFENERTRFCQSDSPFKVEGLNLINSNVAGSFTIGGNVGLVDNKDNTATVFPEQLAVNEYTITYTRVTEMVERT